MDSGTVDSGSQMARPAQGGMNKLKGRSEQSEGIEVLSIPSVASSGGLPGLVWFCTWALQGVAGILCSEAGAEHLPSHLSPSQKRAKAHSTKARSSARNDALCRAKYCRKRMQLCL